MEFARSNGSFDRSMDGPKPDLTEQRYGKLEDNPQAQNPAFRSFAKGIQEYQNPNSVGNVLDTEAQKRVNERNRLEQCCFRGDPVVARAQASLVQAGYDLGKYGYKGVDGEKGPVTAKAITEFQRAVHLEPTGNIDLQTMNMLNLATEKGLKKSEIEMLGKKAARESDPLRQKPQEAKLFQELSPDAQKRIVERDHLAGQTKNGNPFIAKSQASLQMAGYELGKGGVDGLEGSDTSKAVMAYQNDRGLNPTGKLDVETMISLNNATAEEWKRPGMEMKPEPASVSSIKTNQDTVLNFDKGLNCHLTETDGYPPVVETINPTGKTGAETMNAPKKTVGSRPVQETGKENQPRPVTHDSVSNPGLEKKTPPHYTVSYKTATALNRADSTELPKNSVFYDQVKESQNQLHKMGFDIGPEGVDGKLGNHTARAIKDFQTAVHLPVMGELDKTTVTRIESEYKRGLVARTIDTAEETRRLTQENEGQKLVKGNKFKQVQHKQYPNVETPGGGRLADLSEAKSENLITLQGLDKNYQLDFRAAEAYKDMLEQARKDGIKEPLLKIVSGYRGDVLQKQLYDGKLNAVKAAHPTWTNEQIEKETRRWVAPPGRSPHRTGRAIDIDMGIPNDSTHTEQQRDTEVYKWLEKNAVNYGFYNYKNEPWHWEYNPPVYKH